MIANQKVNAGSWYCVVEVDNEDIEQKLVNGEIKGFSLFSYANGASSYKDVPDTSDVHPLFISFVKYPANQVLFEVLDKEMYISKMEAVKMTDKDKSLLDKLKELLSSYDEKKDSDKEEPEEIKKEAGEKEETQEAGEKEETVDKKEVADQEEEVSNADILEAIIELVKAIKDSKDTMKEEVVKPEDEEPETYIIKQATTKVDKKIEKGTEKKQYFDMLGRKL